MARQGSGQRRLSCLLCRVDSFFKFILYRCLLVVRDSCGCIRYIRHDGESFCLAWGRAPRRRRRRRQDALHKLSANKIAGAPAAAAARNCARAGRACVLIAM